MTHAIKYNTEMLDRNDRPYYTRDSAINDANTIKSVLQVRDAILKGRKGAVVTIDENGEVSVTPLGGAEVIVYSEAPNASFGPIVQLGASPPKPYFEPMISAKAGDAAALDAARIEKERKDRQAKMAADHKAWAKSQYERNARINNAAQAISDRMWPKDSPKGFSRGR